MKRKLALLFAVILILVGCDGLNNSSNENGNPSYQNMANSVSSGVWISYSDIKTMLTSGNDFKDEITGVAEKCSVFEIENVYIHVRAHCDSIYPSEYFPTTEGFEGLDYDPLEYIINTFHSKGIKVHAWINPYRVSTATSDFSAVRADSPIHKWLNDSIPENDRNVCSNEGVYLNPAEFEAQALVINGVKEIVKKYKVDGIHFDDYFYPTTNAEFDYSSYQAYTLSAENPLGLEDWRRSNVNSLMNGCYTAIKSINKDVVFSISPAASIENNFHSLYADVSAWLRGGYVDTIIPQLYFGFEYPDPEFNFDRLLKEWKELSELNPNTELLVGLASYKIGTSTTPDRDEWINGQKIIDKQIEICRKDDRVSGYVLFSYASFPLMDFS